VLFLAAFCWTLPGSKCTGAIFSEVERARVWAQEHKVWGDCDVIKIETRLNVFIVVSRSIFSLLRL
jgi:hypothetical protein